MKKPNAEEIETGVMAVAQAVVNIAQGHDTIKDGSRLYREMDLLLTPENEAAIMAAPELLGALRDLVSDVELVAPQLRMRLEQARAAIAKATGGKR